MTTTIGVGARTSAELLYLSVDLGHRPSVEDFGRNAAALLTLARYATFIASPGMIDPKESPPGLPETDLRIVRTSLASPWVTVLADLARSSAPIAYSVTALYALHRLLQMVITWQRHRQNMAERDLRLQQLRKEFSLLDKEKLVPRHIREQRFGRRRKSSMALEPYEVAFQAAQGLGEIQSAEMISADDPRAAGSGDAPIASEE